MSKKKLTVSQKIAILEEGLLNQQKAYSRNVDYVATALENISDRIRKAEESLVRLTSSSVHSADLQKIRERLFALEEAMQLKKSLGGKYVVEQWVPNSHGGHSGTDPNSAIRMEFRQKLLKLRDQIDAMLFP